MKHSEVFIYDNWLAHHGILGMHWGIRRFQNEDGSLTNAGKSRYESDSRSNRGKDARNYKQSTKKPNSNQTSALSNPKVKKAVKTGAKAVLTALAIYGGYKLASHQFKIKDPQKIAKLVSETNLDFIRDAERFGYPISFNGKFI